MIAQLIGAILGQLISGWGSDIIVNRRTRRTGTRLPEYRLIFAYPGFLLAIAGLTGTNFPRLSGPYSPVPELTPRLL